MKFRIATLLLFILIAIAAVWLRQNDLRRRAAPYLNAPRIGPAALYPNAALTPGNADTLEREEIVRHYPCPPAIRKASCTYSQAHRSVSAEEHREIYDEYSVPAARRNAEYGEVDHLNPLCNGGSNDRTNLWYQLAANYWNGENYGYHEKDELEEWICEQVKSGELDPAAAYQRITNDWVRFYMEIKRESGFRRHRYRNDNLDIDE